MRSMKARVRPAVVVVTASLALAATAVLLGGCSKGVELKPPDMASYETIAIAPLVTPDPDFGRLAARDLGNQLQIALKQKNKNATVVFDETADIQPISDAMERLKLGPDEVFADSKLAAKVAEELGADIVIVGRASKINIRTKEDDRPVYDMSAQAGISGTTKYTIVWQWASSRVAVKVVTSSGEVLWQTGTTPPKEPGDLSAYIRYAKAFQSQVPEKPPVSDDVIRTHMRDQTWRLIAHKLYPSDFIEIKVPVWREKPAQTFKASGGIVRFE